MVARQMNTSNFAISVVCVLAAACAGPGDRAGSAEGAPPAAIVTAPSIALPPVASVGTHVDTLHEVAVPDPYRWLEDTTAADARTWVAAQEGYAAAVLARGIALDSLTTLYANVYRDAPTLSRLVESPAAIAATFRGRIREIGPSRTGELLVVTTTAAGDSGPAVMVVNAATGVPLADLRSSRPSTYRSPSHGSAAVG